MRVHCSQQTSFKRLGEIRLVGYEYEEQVDGREWIYSKH
jgi:hypothetical protein